VEPLKKVEKPIWQVGDTWVYQQTDTDGSKIIKSVIKIAVVESNDTGYVTAVDNGDKKTVDFYTKEINYVRTTDEKGKMVKSCEPEIPVFKWPLEPGKSWQGTYSDHRDNKFDSRFVSLTTEVVGAETIVTTNGQEVATLKLVSKRLTRAGKKIVRDKFLGKFETWYDPLSRFVIKRVDYSSSEKTRERNLVSFTPGGGGTK
jgi:hypothetical protein